MYRLNDPKQVARPSVRLLRLDLHELTAPDSMHAIVELTVNGYRKSVGVPTRYTLLEALRYSMGLTGSEQGCAKGDRGACRVLFVGEPILSCITTVGESDGWSVSSVDG